MGDLATLAKHGVKEPSDLLQNLMRGRPGQHAAAGEASVGFGSFLSPLRRPQGARVASVAEVDRGQRQDAAGSEECDLIRSQLGELGESERSTHAPSRQDGKGLEERGRLGARELRGPRE